MCLNKSRKSSYFKIMSTDCDHVRSVPELVFASDWCSGIPTAHAPGGHRPVLPPAGVHAHGPPHPLGGLRALLLRRAARPQRQTAQREREALAVQFHHPGYARSKRLIDAIVRCMFNFNKLRSHVFCDPHPVAAAKEEK